MTRALVTGGAGFIRHHLCAPLPERGGEVPARGDMSTGRVELLQGIDSPMQLVQLDLRDQHGVSALMRDVRPDWVFHLAGLHFIPACNRDPVATLGINTLGTAGLFEAIRACESVRR